MQYLEEQYAFDKIDYKMFHPNLIRNNEYIECHQKINSDFTIEEPMIIAKKINKKINKRGKK